MRRKRQVRPLDVIASALQAARRAESGNLITIGNLLIEAKAQLEHGQWLPWLAANFGGSASSAENYMNVAKLAAKFPTVGNLKLSSSALYALVNLDKTANREAIEAVLKEAETEWVSGERVWQIEIEVVQALRRSEPAKSEEEIEAENEAARREQQEELEAHLAGPPPELPPAPEPVLQDVVLPSFDGAVRTLAALQTKPLAKFDGTAHKANDIHKVCDFLLMVADRVQRLGSGKVWIAAQTKSQLEPSTGGRKVM
jgi:hypothetical protein